MPERHRGGAEEDLASGDGTARPSGPARGRLEPVEKVLTK